MKYSIVIAFIIVLTLGVACNIETNTDPFKPTDRHDHGEVDLVMLMGRMQLYMNKLYFAGINNNKELRDFYVHELEEAMAEISEGNVTHEGVDISENMKLYGVSQLNIFEKALEQDRDFNDAYRAFINSCNSCHMVSKYPFIIIQKPTNPVFDNQVYETK